MPANFNWELMGLQQGQGLHNQFNPWMQNFLQSAHDDWLGGGSQYGITGGRDDFNTWMQGMVDRWHQMSPEQKWVTSLFNAQNGLTGWGNAQQHWNTYGADSAHTGGRTFPGGERETEQEEEQEQQQRRELPRGAGNTEAGREAYLENRSAGAQQAYRQKVMAWIQGGRKGPMPTHPDAPATEPANGAGASGAEDPGSKNATQPGGGGGRRMTGGAGGGVRGHWVSGPPGARPGGGGGNAGTPGLGGVMPRSRPGPNVTDAGSLTANSQPGLGGVMPQGGTPGLGGVMPQNRLRVKVNPRKRSLYEGR